MSRISENDIIRDIDESLKVWAEVVDLTFVRVAPGEDATLVFSFVPTSHGDGYDFDGPGNVLAHAFYPGDNFYSGSVHFEDRETWTVRFANCKCKPNSQSREIFRK